MSRPVRETVVCPKCGHEGEAVIWSSLNNVLSPNEANELLFGNLFGYTCPECGNATELCYACLYHDMEKHAMVQYVPDESQAEATVAHLDGFLDGDIPHCEMDEAGYRYRIVFDHNRLREKARIFHDGLDDRIVETLKLMVEAMASENIGDMGSVPVYYDSIEDDGDLVFALLADEIMVATIPRTAYDELKPEPTNSPDRDYVIDRNWAIENFTATTGSIDENTLR